MKVSSILALAAPVLAIVPEARIVHPNLRQSLPNLLKAESRNDFLDNWDLRDNLDLESGRFTVKKGQGSIWSKLPLVNSKGEWTIDLVFRNSEQVDVNDHTYYDTNGLSFWLLDSNIPSDVLNFGGPKSFDGLQFLINNKDNKGLKIYANDNSKEIRNSEQDAIGGCNLNYLDSMVPFTLRVSYSSSKKWFKVQVDNNLCFKTDVVSFANLKRDLTFGVSASVEQRSQEYWEILKLDVVEGLTADAIDDHGIVEAGGVKVVTVTQADAKPTGAPGTQSLMERMAKGQAETSNNVKTAHENGNNNADLSVHFKALDQKIETISSSLKMVPELLSTLKTVQQNQASQLQAIEDLKAKYNTFESLLGSHYKELTEDSRVSNRKMLDEIALKYSDTSKLVTSVELLVKKNKEFQNQGIDTQSQSSEFFGVIVKWVLIPLAIGITALIVVVYRLKKDIKHSKLL